MEPLSQASTADLLPAISIAICVGAMPLIALLGRWPNLREAVSLLAGVANFAVVLMVHAGHHHGEAAGVELVRLTPDVAIGLRVDDLGLIFALVASGLWILNTLYSIGYMRAHQEHKQTRFYICFAGAIAAAMGAAFSADLLSLFVFYECLTLVTYPLVIHEETETARAGARRYLAYLLGLSLLCFLPAVFLTASMAGSLDFLPDGLLFERAPNAAHGLLALTFVLFLVGIGKAALMPFHGWLPAAMVAPTPVSALLHAVAVVKMGVFTVSRVVFHVFGTELLGSLGLQYILVVAACVTILLASLIALGQDNLKRRLAYSTVSQLSYILLGIGLLVPVGAEGGLLHIGMHAASKITLFFCAGAILVATHKTEISQLDGVGRRMPFTMTAFTIGSLSMIGLPPFAGMVSKDELAAGAAEGHYPAVLFVLIASTLLNAAYFLPIVWRAFFRERTDGERGIREAPWPCVVALSTTAVLTVLLFFFPDVFRALAEGVVGHAGGGH